MEVAQNVGVSQGFGHSLAEHRSKNTVKPMSKVQSSIKKLAEPNNENAQTGLRFVFSSLASDWHPTSAHKFTATTRCMN